LNAKNTTSNLKKTLDTCHKTLYVAYIKNIHHILVNVAFMCNTSKTASSNSEFLAGEISFSKILVKSEQSLRVKSPGFTFLEIELSIIINNCHGLNIICLKYNIASLPLNHPPSTVVTG